MNFYNMSIIIYEISYLCVLSLQIKKKKKDIVPTYEERSTVFVNVNTDQLAHSFLGHPYHFHKFQFYFCTPANRLSCQHLCELTKITARSSEMINYFKKL